MATLPARELTALPQGHPCDGCSVRDTAVCGVLCCDHLAELRNSGATQRLEAGQPLFHEGDPATQVYNVTEGALKLTKLLPDGRRQVMAFILPGDFVGISLGGEHAFTAEALKRTRMCRFSRSRFHDFADEHPELEREIYRLAAHELAAAQAQMLLLGRKSALERVASFLLDLGKRQQKGCSGLPRSVSLPMSRIEIADYLGLTKETVSRVFAELKSRRLIRLITLNDIELIDRRNLAELAEGYVVQ
ncbi:cyclic nucleotide-binding domain-containing protein [Sphingomonas sp. LHG3406-1]|uniref:cyclic nucleotide-binding domain-containing protein n=1 Tax=Sphingomonas sp. LHG3406-1 TaxID=2804617 RepID=UPI00261A12ED|nr:cyclic nucleotide-binding domain-containing protein [Sphingomonas sp. LHG3406-1]